MKEYNYESIDKHIQWLIKMMETEFPNGYELIINSNGAEIRSNQQYLNFLSNKFKDKMPSVIDTLYKKDPEE